MRGEERRQRSMLIVVNPEQRVPKEHPLRRIKQMADTALKELSPIFEQMYSRLGGRRFLRSVCLRPRC